MTEASKILLAHHLKTLKLPTFLREYDKLARQCAAEGLDHVGFLTRLVELELIDRERRMVERRIKAAKFPVTKSLDSFDFKAIPKLNKMQVQELATATGLAGAAPGKPKPASGHPSQDWTSGPKRHDTRKLSGARASCRLALAQWPGFAPPNGRICLRR